MQLETKNNEKEERPNNYGLLLVTNGIATRSKRLLVAPGSTTSNKKLLVCSKLF